MRKWNLIFFLLLVVGAVHAQFVNNGATVTIQSGATLRVETNFINNSGTVTNNGTLEVMGNLTNAATITSDPASIVRFIGSANSDVTSGTAVFQNVEMSKTANNITLIDPMTIAKDLNFVSDNNKVILGANNLTMQAAATVTSPDANEYVVTDGAGMLVKGLTASGTVTHEIGDASNYTPLSSAVTGSAYASATLGAKVYTTPLQAKYAGATDYINREWNVVSAGITDYANTMTGTYVAGDATGTQASIKGSTYHTGDWHFDGSSNGVLQVIASTTNGDVKLSGQNFFGKVNVKAFLQGPYSVGTGLMTTALNAPTGTNILETYALTSPYLDAPASVSAGFFLANPTIVDWVKLELRDPSAPSVSTTFKTSAFIKSNGDIVGLDGTSLPSIKGGFPTSVVVLSHRNHLPIRTVDAGIDAVNAASQHNFSSGLAQAYDNILIANDAMVLTSTGVYALFRGNPNSNNSINSADLGIVTNQSNPTKSNVYNTSDLNLNGLVNSADLGIVTNQSNPTKSAHQ